MSKQEPSDMDIDNANNEKELPVANQRGSARLGAVQALYQMDVGQVPLSDVLAEFETYRLGRLVDGDEYRPADLGYFKLIVKGVFNAQRNIDTQIDKVMTGKWSLKRLDTTVRAILRCGVFELIYRAEVPTGVIVKEYLDIAAAFFDGDEIKFINGVLDTIAKERDNIASELF